MATRKRQFGPRNLAAWRYLVPGPGCSVAVAGDISDEHRRLLLETFEGVEPWSFRVRADGLLVAPGARLPAEAARHMAQGGWVARLSRRPGRRSAARRTHVVLPSLDAPRFLLPRAALAGGLALYTPSRPIVRLALGLVTGTPLHRGLPWVGGQLDVLGGRDADLLAPPGHHLAVSTGTPSAYHKATLLLMDERQQEVSYMKLSRRPLASAVLDVEADRLIRIRELGPWTFDVPRLVRRVRWGLEGGIELSAPERALPPWREGLSDAIVDVAVELFEKTRTERVLRETSFFHELEGWARSVEPHLEPPWRDRIRRAMALSLAEAPPSPEPAGWAHGDFIDWNVKGSGRTIFIFDWEQSADEAPPFFDLLHWVVFTHYHVRARRDALATVLHGGGEFSRARARMEAALRLTLEPRHIRLYALRTALYHLRAWLPTYEDVRIQHASALRGLAAVLDQL